MTQTAFARAFLASSAVNLGNNSESVREQVLSKLTASRPTIFAPLNYNRFLFGRLVLRLVLVRCDAKQDLNKEIESTQKVSLA